MREHLFKLLYHCVVTIMAGVAFSGCATQTDVTYDFDTRNADVLPRDAAIEYVNVYVDANEKGILLGYGEKINRYGYDNTYVKIEKYAGGGKCYVFVLWASEDTSNDNEFGYMRLPICDGNAEEITRKLLTALVSLGVTPQ